MQPFLCVLRMRIFRGSECIGHIFFFSSQPPIQFLPPPSSPYGCSKHINRLLRIAIEQKVPGVYDVVMPRKHEVMSYNHEVNAGSAANTRFIVYNQSALSNHRSF